MGGRQRHFVRIEPPPLRADCPLLAPQGIGVTNAKSSQAVVEPRLFQKLTPARV